MTSYHLPHIVPQLLQFAEFADANARQRACYFTVTKVHTNLMAFYFSFRHVLSFKRTLPAIDAQQEINVTSKKCYKKCYTIGRSLTLSQPHSLP